MSGAKSFMQILPADPNLFNSRIYNCPNSISYTLEIYCDYCNKNPYPVPNRRIGISTVIVVNYGPKNIV